MEIIDAFFILLITFMLLYEYFLAISDVVDIPPLAFIIIFVILIVNSLFGKHRKIEKQFDKVKGRKDKGKDSLNSTPNLTSFRQKSPILWLFDLLDRWRKRHKQEIV